MKKILSMLALLACLVTATACTMQNGDQSVPSASAEPTVSTSELSVTPSLTTTPLETTVTPPQTIVTTPPVTSFPPPAIGKGEAIEYTPVEGQPQLQEITSLDSDGWVSSVSYWDRFMLINFYYADEPGHDEPDPDETESGEYPEYTEWTDVVIVDLLTGEVTGRYRYDYAVDAGFLEDGSIYFFKKYPFSITVYDRTGVATVSYEFAESGQYVIDPADGGVAWFSDWDGRSIVRLPLDGGEAYTYEFPEDTSSYIQSAVGGEAYLTVFGESDRTELVCLSAEGEIEKLSAVRDYYGMDDVLYRPIGDSWYVFDPENGNDLIYSFGVEEPDAYIAATDDGAFCVVWHDDESPADRTKLILCRPLVATRTEITLSEQYFMGHCWGEDRLYLLISDESGGYTVYVWDYLSAHQSPLEMSVETITEQEKQNLKAADDLYEEWGVSIYFGEEDMERTPYDYSCAPLDDQLLIADTLKAFSGIFAEYPEGFFDDLAYGDYDHLEIYFSSELAPNDGYGISTAIAISNTRGSALVMVLDLTEIDDLRQTFSHELLHLMEHRINQIDPSLLTDWVTLTPGGADAYYNSYHDENNNEMNDYSHTWYGEVDMEIVYFVDAYSKSSPAEDRCRIFEYLVKDNGDPFYSDAPVLMAKAERICEIIRLTFPSVANAGNVFWEVE